VRIIESAVVDRILKALADPENTRIMMCILGQSKSAQAISAETAIPQSTVYRKLDELKEAGLVMTQQFVVSAGKRVDYLIVTFSEVKLSVQDGRRVIELVPTDTAATAKWLGLFRGD